jgi:hypothetical protein
MEPASKIEKRAPASSPVFNEQSRTADGKWICSLDSMNGAPFTVACKYITRVLKIGIDNVE